MAELQSTQMQVVHTREYRENVLCCQIDRKKQELLLLSEKKSLNTSCHLIISLEKYPLSNLTIIARLSQKK
jgi:hypothetical protein